MFKINVPTNSGQFVVDKKWQRKANPFANKNQEQMDKYDRELLEKRRHQKVLQNMALEQQYKIVVKKQKEI